MGKGKKRKLRGWVDEAQNLPPLTAAEVLNATLGELADGMTKAFLGEELPRDPVRESTLARHRVKQLERTLENLNRRQTEQIAELEAAVADRDARIADLETAAMLCGAADAAKWIEEHNQ